MKNIIEKLIELFGNSIFLIMLLLWASGYFLAMMIYAFDSGDKTGTALCAVFSFAAFAGGFILRKSETQEEEKRKPIKHNGKRI